MAEAAFKPEKDFSKQVDELLPQAEELAKAGFFFFPKVIGGLNAIQRLTFNQTDLHGAIEKLTALEKQASHLRD